MSVAFGRCRCVFGQLSDALSGSFRGALEQVLGRSRPKAAAKLPESAPRLPRNSGRNCSAQFRGQHTGPQA
eukprot:14885820-Alexandrium_andersonii.AAC.1